MRELERHPLESLSLDRSDVVIVDQGQVIASAIALAALLGASGAGCNELAGIRAAVLDPCAFMDESCASAGDSGAGGSTATATASTSATAADSTGAGSGVSVAASSGAGMRTGAGMSGGMCGDGIVSAGEECDDHNATPHDGCTACVVDCSGSGTFKDPARHHCYRLVTSRMTFAQALASCALAGEHLAAITTGAEFALVEAHVDAKMEAWIGGNDMLKEGTFVWTDGEPWGYAPWVAGAPSKSPNRDCVALDAEDGGFNDEDCNKKLVALCERGAAGASL
jgi:cysteine-rich repeat protein